MTLTAKLGSTTNALTGGGFAPVAVNDSGQVVIVMLGKSAIEYMVGSINLGAQTVTFPANTATAYSWGNVAADNIDVAMYGNQVVLVFEIGGGENELYYMTGTLNGNTISWNKAVNYDKGTNPSVTINHSTVIEVHASQNKPQNMWYNKGTLDGAIIDSFDQGGTAFRGTPNEITSLSCVSSDNSWLVVTADTGYTYGGIYCYTAPSSNCNVVADAFIAGGASTSVTWCSWGIVIEAHTPNAEDLINPGIIFLAIGWIDGDVNDKTYGQITWQDPQQNTGISGGRPYIAAAGDYAIMTYMSTDGTFSTKAVVISRGS
jgi:hypothetical protein